MSALQRFLEAGREVIEEMSRERLPRDVVLRKLLHLSRHLTDAVAETLIEEPEAQ